VNTVRKHLSGVKGGRLAAVAWPAQVAVLVLSDVIGNPLDAIASGPLTPDPTTYTDALEILRRYEIEDRVPPRVLRYLRSGASGEIDETPKPGDPVFERVRTTVVGSVVQAAEAARAEASSRGYASLILSTSIEGEAREVARVVSALATEERHYGRPAQRPACLILGGETTVTVRGSGRGGRNQELALAAALSLEGCHGTLVVSFATDGTDGPTDAAGAVADGDTMRRAREKGLDARLYLANNDAYTFFDTIGDLLRTGPTNTNVNDLILVMAK
jgi:hydroxypyruvate reductase